MYVFTLLHTYNFLFYAYRKVLMIKKKIQLMSTMKTYRPKLKSLTRLAMNLKPLKNMLQTHMRKLTTSTLSKSRMYSRSTERASQKDLSHSNSYPTASCFGMVQELLTMQAYCPRVCVLLHQRLRSPATCLVKVYTSPTWFQNQPITVTPPDPTIRDCFSCVMLL